MSSEQQKLSIADRLCLVQALNALPAPQFDELVFALKPPSGNIPGSAAAQSSRSAALLEWVESPVGPGLSELEKALEKTTDGRASSHQAVSTQQDLKPEKAVPHLNSKVHPVRTKLLRDLQNEIDSRLDDSLHELIKIDMRIEEQQKIGKPKLELVPEDVSNNAVKHSSSYTNRVFRPAGQEEVQDVTLEPTQSLLPILERRDVQGRLLILGEPGVGKTTELIALAHDLLTKAVQDESEPIPVIFELSTWEENLPIEQWILAQLSRLYIKKETISQDLLEQAQLVLLLDGLDELGLEKQQKCIEAINQFLQEKDYLYTVICCRQEEYEAGQAILDQINGTVYIQSLTDEQIQSYLRDLNRFRLWKGIKKNPKLLSLARKPLFLTMLVVAYQGKPIQNESELFDLYIKKQLGISKGQTVYLQDETPNREKTLHYMSWLANQLERLEETEFLIEEMQPSWLSAEFQQMYPLVSSISFGLFLGVGFGLSSWINFGPTFGFFAGLTNWLSFPFLTMTIKTFFRPDETILPIEKLTWSVRNWLRAGLSVGVITGLFSWPFLGPVFGSIVGFLFSLLLGIDLVDVEKKSFPNQGIRRSLGNFYAICILFMPVFGLVYWLGFEQNKGWEIGASLGLAIGLCAALFLALMPVIQHYTLRFLLAEEGSFPWDCVRFLDYATERRLMQRVGGRYRFIHNMLRQHLASKTLPPSA